ncbi:MAG: hypothetical protein ACOY30_13845 [Bacillota bacterium]
MCIIKHRLEKENRDPVPEIAPVDGKYKQQKGGKPRNYHDIGPIALGLIGMTGGGALGYLPDRRINKKKKSGERSSGEIIVAVLCYNDDDAVLAGQIMRDHHVAAVGRGPDI